MDRLVNSAVLQWEWMQLVPWQPWPTSSPIDWAGSWSWIPSAPGVPSHQQLQPLAATLLHVPHRKPLIARHSWRHFLQSPAEAIAARLRCVQDHSTKVAEYQPPADVRTATSRVPWTFVGLPDRSGSATASSSACWWGRRRWAPWCAPRRPLASWALRGVGFQRSLGRSPEKATSGRRSKQITKLERTRWTQRISMDFPGIFVSLSVLTVNTCQNGTYYDLLFGTMKWHDLSWTMSKPGLRIWKEMKGESSSKKWWTIMNN